MAFNLVVQTAFLGDLLLSIPLLKKMRQQWPDHQLALVCRKGLGDFFLKTGIVDQVFEIKKGDRDSYERALKSLRQMQINVLVSPHESFRTTFFNLKLNAKTKVSYKNWSNGWVYSTRVQKNSSLPEALRQLSLLRTFDPILAENLDHYSRSEKPYLVDGDHRLSEAPSWASMSLKDLLNRDVETWQKLKHKFDFLGALKPNQKRILLFPGSVWATKRWTPEGFTGVGQYHVKAGHQVIIMGGPGEESLAQEVGANIPGAFVLAGDTTIYESAQVILHSDLVVGNDSASTHLAAVCETPLIAVFGPTVLRFGFRPWSHASFVKENTDLACRPCGPHGHHKCPLGTHECMKSVTADEVSRLSATILQKYNPSH